MPTWILRLWTVGIHSVGIIERYPQSTEFQSRFWYKRYWRKSQVCGCVGTLGKIGKWPENSTRRSAGIPTRGPVETIPVDSFLLAGPRGGAVDYYIIAVGGIV